MAHHLRAKSLTHELWKDILDPNHTKDSLLPMGQSSLLSLEHKPFFLFYFFSEFPAPALLMTIINLMEATWTTCFPPATL